MPYQALPLQKPPCVWAILTICIGMLVIVLHSCTLMVFLFSSCIWWALISAATQLYGHCTYNHTLCTGRQESVVKLCILWWALISAATQLYGHCTYNHTLCTGRQESVVKLCILHKWARLCGARSPYVVVPRSCDEVVGIRTKGDLAYTVIWRLLNFKILHRVVSRRYPEILEHRHVFRTSKSRLVPKLQINSLARDRTQPTTLPDNSVNDKISTGLH